MHDLTLFYTTDGDGIWMDCKQCKIRVNLGHEPTTEKVAALATAHRTENP